MQITRAALSLRRFGENYATSVLTSAVSPGRSLYQLRYVVDDDQVGPGVPETEVGLVVNPTQLTDPAAGSVRKPRRWRLGDYFNVYIRGEHLQGDHRGDRPHHGVLEDSKFAPEEQHPDGEGEER